MAKPRRRQAYTPALIENLRFRFEETAESVVDIAASVPTSHTTLRALARQHGWTKYQPPPLDLSPAAKLAADVARLADAMSPLPPRSGAAAGGAAAGPETPPRVDLITREMLS